jgi:hypothetical protein
MEFLEAECETGTLIGALLALIHPELFEQQVQVLEVLAVGLYRRTALKHSRKSSCPSWSVRFTSVCSTGHWC